MILIMGSDMVSVFERITNLCSKYNVVVSFEFDKELGIYHIRIRNYEDNWGHIFDITDKLIHSVKDQDVLLKTVLSHIESEIDDFLATNK